MQTAEGSVKYYHSLQYKRYNISLPFRWTLFFHKDRWSCDVRLYKPGKLIELVWFRRYNTLYGMAWIVVILGVNFQSIVARKAAKGVNNEM